MDRRTKIVATLGPATDAPGALEAILAAGVDVARINFSHGAADEHRTRIRSLRAAATKLNRVVAIMADLPGPKLRANIAVERTLTKDETVAFSLSDTTTTDDITITEPELLADVEPGQRILLDDGRLVLTATSKDSTRLHARVLIGGVLKPKKGINLPDTPLTIAAVTDRDREALAVACDAGVDWLALSFVRTAAAADELRTIAKAHGFEGRVLAKIERPEAVRDIDAIVKAFDGVMVARGDLGVEMALESVPAAQKKVIASARAAGRPVITATEMLESMTKNPRPTRAEASDVANAIFDGTDAVMLSGETAVGEHAPAAVACMARIAREAEAYMRTFPWKESEIEHGLIDDPIAQAACELAVETKSHAIITPTLSGRTARRLARHRPWPTIVAPAPTDTALRSMAMVWGVAPVPMGSLKAGDDRLGAAVKDAFLAGCVKPGDRVVVLAGHPVEGGPLLPTLRVVRVGEGGTSETP